MPLDLATLSLDELSTLTLTALSQMDVAGAPVRGDYYIPPGAAINWRDATDDLSLMMQRVAAITPVAEAPTDKTPTPIPFMAELDLGGDVSDVCYKSVR